MTLGQLVQFIPDCSISGDSNVQIRGISIDSRQVEQGDLFIALKGAQSTGARYVEEAIGKGAVAIACDESLHNTKVPFVRLLHPRRHLGTLASQVYGSPGSHMSVVGITGTNGKTTTSLLVEAILNHCGRFAGYIGTTAYRWKGLDSTGKGVTTEKESVRTSPEAPELHKMIREMHKAGVTDVVVECSSHGLEYGRLNGLALDVAVFTNLTPEHLDFHKDMDRYREAKWKLFGDVLYASSKKQRTAVLNLDDATGKLWAGRISEPKLTYSLENPKADLFAENYSFTPKGLQAALRIGGEQFEIRSPLIGRHNVANILAALCTADVLHIPLRRAIEALNEVHVVPGRLEAIPNSRGYHLFVDYAHTEDALRNVLEAITPIKDKRLIVVFGCGGDRDRTKRPRMTQAVLQFADVALLTSDNPRSEDPNTIVEQALAGAPQNIHRVNVDELNTASQSVICPIVDRRKALERALEIMEFGDTLLVAGKGHETYQEINGIRLPFDDREILKGALGGKK